MAQHARPHVLIIGGFLTDTVMYRPMRRRLLEQGAERVSIAPIHLPDWAVMGFAGMGPLLLRGARAIRQARRASPEPIIVVGHSMGGIIARLALSPEPLDGRFAGVAEDVGCVVTLGTPHRFDPAMPWRHAGQRAAEHLERVSPGAWFAPRTGYLTVGSSLVRPTRRALPSSPAIPPAIPPAPSLRRSPGMALNRVLRSLVGETPGATSDGLVGSDRCRLAGVRHIELSDVLHGLWYGPWYGDAEVIHRWWPAAVEEWQAALAARCREAESEASRAA